MFYNDNNLIKYDNRTLNERFKKPTKMSIQGKSFVRGGNKKLLIPSTLIFGINIYSVCNSKGEKISTQNLYFLN